MINVKDEIMQEEIFGPLLPIIEFEHVNEAISKIQDMPTPLALYIFATCGATQTKILDKVAFGGGCINDTIMHLSTPYMPFDEGGSSGLSGYHGEFGFEAFTHKKSIFKSPSFIDPPLRYHPYTSLKQKLLRWLL